MGFIMLQIIIETLTNIILCVELSIGFHIITHMIFNRVISGNDIH